MSLLFVGLFGCGGGGSGTPDAGPLLVDQCTNAADLAIIQDVVLSFDGGALDGDVPDGSIYPDHYAARLGDVLEACTNEVCLSAILTETDVYACLTDCLATTPAAGLSEGCLSCQVDVVDCAIDFCFLVCQGTDQTLCVACATENCGPRLSECSGLPNDLNAM